MINCCDFSLCFKVFSIFTFSTTKYLWRVFRFVSNLDQYNRDGVDETLEESFTYLCFIKLFITNFYDICNYLVIFVHIFRLHTVVFNYSANEAFREDVLHISFHKKFEYFGEVLLNIS